MARPGPRPNLADDRGAAATEFAMLLPVFVLILVGTIDFGGALYTKFRLNAALSAGANYALVNAGRITAADAAGLAGNIASLLSGSSTARATSGTVVVNNGATVTLTSGTATTSGTAANADSWYCPTLTGSGLSWGAGRASSEACDGGSRRSGKFVAITASQPYTPFFSNYGIVQNGAISEDVVVQAR